VPVSSLIPRFKYFHLNIYGFMHFGNMVALEL
jgi:hypothetical protein